MKLPPTPSARQSASSLVLLLAATTLLSCSSTAGDDKASAQPSASPSALGPPQSETYPNAIVVMGHSGTTGAESDPDSPGTDARENSWATGDNPAVNSIYTRLLALNPAVQGHNTNLGVDGTNTDGLAAQVDQALALDPLPDLFMIQEVDNDIRCDGTDRDNYPHFAQNVTQALTRITEAAPDATVLLVSSPPGTVENYGAVAVELPGGKANNTGTGPCDLFSPSGKAVPAHWRYQEKVILGYQGQLADVCQKFPSCVYDGGALYRMPVTAEDFATNGNHLTIAGHAKQAELEWGVLGLDS